MILIFSDKITSYKDLLNTKYKDSIITIEDPRALVAMAAMETGHDENDASDNALKLRMLSSRIIKKHYFMVF